MQTTVVKWVSIAALLLTVVFWQNASSYQLVLKGLVSVAAAVVLVQAFQQGKQIWAIVFLAVAVLFNPAVPVIHFAGVFSLLLVIVSITPFAISLVALKPQPLLSMASITDRTPGSESL